MNVGFRCLLPRSDVCAAALLPLFDEQNDFLALAMGNQLLYDRVDSLESWNPKCVEFFGEIVDVVPLFNLYSLHSNLLVIFDNFKAAVFDASGTEKQTLNLCPSLEAKMPSNLKCAIHPNCLAFAFGNCHIRILPVSSRSLIEKPFTVDVGCKRIRKLCFAGPLSKVVRLVVLAEDFANTTSLHAIDLDLGNGTYELDPRRTVEMAHEMYTLASLLPADCSTVVALSSNRAESVMYMSGVTPNVSTATIFTTDKIMDIKELSGNLFAYVDEKGRVGKVELHETGRTTFVTVYEPENSMKGDFFLVTLKENLVFVGAEHGDSIVLDLSQGARVVKLFPSSGLVKYTQMMESGYFLQSERSLIDSKISLGVQKLSCFPAKGFETIWCGESGNSVLLSGSCGTIEVSLKGERINGSSYNSKFPTLFAQALSGTFVWLTTERLVIQNVLDKADEFVAGDADAQRNFVCAATLEKCFLFGSDGRELHSFSGEGGRIKSVSICSSFLAVLSDSIRVYSLDDYKLLRLFPSEQVMDICFDPHESLVALSSTEKIFVHRINSVASTELLLTGVHFSLHKTHRGLLISGTNPSVITRSGFVSLGGDPILSASESKCDSIFSLTPTSVHEFKLVSGRVTNTPSPIPSNTVAAFYVNQKLLHVLADGDSLYWSASLGPIDHKQVVDWYVHSSYIYILFSDAIVCYQYDGHSVQVIHEMSVENARRIHHVAGQVLISTEKSVILYPDSVPVLTTGHSISTLAVSETYAALLDTTGVLFVYARDEYAGRYSLVASSAYSDSVIAIAVLGGSILCSTRDAELHLFNVFPGVRPGEYDLRLCDKIRTGDAIIALYSHTCSVIAAAEHGSVFEITGLDPIPDLRTLYDELAPKVVSPAHLTKLDERRNFSGRYSSSGAILDLEILMDFLSRDTAHQNDIVTSPHILESLANLQ